MTTIEQVARTIPTAVRTVATKVNAHLDRADTAFLGAAVGASVFSPWWFLGLLMVAGYAAVQALLWTVYALAVRKSPDA